MIKYLLFFKSYLSNLEKKATDYNDDTPIEKELEPTKKSKEKDSLPGATTIIHPVKSI